MDRKLSTSMVYPCNYGFIPQTKTENGDPIDVLVLDSEPLVPCYMVKVRPIRVRLAEDKDGKDSKVIAVPTHDCEFNDIQNIANIAESKRKQIDHFLEHHKELEKTNSLR